jgi:hypothetical protein
MPKWIAPHRDHELTTMMLMFCGRAAVPALREIVRSEEGDPRLGALKALGSIGRDAAPAVPELTEALRDESEPVRFYAARALGAIGAGARDAMPALRGLLTDKEPSVQRMAGTSLVLVRASLLTGDVTARNTLLAGYMYWAPPRPLLMCDALMVVGGTVVGTWREGTGKTPASGVGGLMHVERTFLLREGRGMPAGGWCPGMTYLQSEGFDGLKRGDKLIVFLNSYDDGAAIRPVLGSNCPVGIKLKDWNDPIVPAVKAVCGSSDVKKVLADEKHRAAWRRFDPVGVESILTGKHWAGVASKLPDKPAGKGTGGKTE